MRKYLLPTALILLLGVGYSIAQTISRAIQLSQDLTGAFSVDTNNGVYFPGHILSTNTGRIGAAASISGNASPTITGTDSSGVVTMGAAATTATILFGTAYLSVPNCLVVSQAVATPIGFTLFTTAIQMTFTAQNGMKANYWCSSAS